MKTVSRISGALIVGCLCLAAVDSRADLEVGASVSIHAKGDFDAPLAEHGKWVDVHGHGRCWRPRGVAVTWQPYCDGDWLWTDDGWYWDSDEPWAWACYHYGTWYDDPDVGWVWVPDVEWAPAWVVWREGGGYIGWAPCAPAGVVIAPGFFAFVDVHHFGDHFRRDHLIFNNHAVFAKATEVHQVNRESRDINGTRRSVVFNGGPRVDAVRKESHADFREQHIADVSRRSPAPQNLAHRAEQRERGEPQQPLINQAQPERETETKRPPVNEQPSHVEPGAQRPFATQEQPKAVREQQKPVAKETQPTPAPERERVLPQRDRTQEAPVRERVAPQEHIAPPAEAARPTQVAPPARPAPPIEHREPEHHDKDKPQS